MKARYKDEITRCLAKELVMKKDRRHFKRTHYMAAAVTKYGDSNVGEDGDIQDEDQLKEIEKVLLM